MAILFIKVTILNKNGVKGSELFKLIDVSKFY